MGGRGWAGGRSEYRREGNVRGVTRAFLLRSPLRSRNAYTPVCSLSCIGSIGYSAQLGFYFTGLQAFEANIRLYTAPSLTGPWAPEDIYSVLPLPVNATLAYAAKSHPELLPQGQVRIEATP